MRSEGVTAPPGAVCWARVPCLGCAGMVVGAPDGAREAIEWKAGNEVESEPAPANILYS